MRVGAAAARAALARLLLHMLGDLVVEHTVAVSSGAAKVVRACGWRLEVHVPAPLQ